MDQSLAVDITVLNEVCQQTNALHTDTHTNTLSLRVRLVAQDTSVCCTLWCLVMMLLQIGIHVYIYTTHTALTRHIHTSITRSKRLTADMYCGECNVHYTRHIRTSMTRSKRLTADMYCGECNVHYTRHIRTSMTRSKRLTADMYCGECNVHPSTVSSRPSTPPITVHAASTMHTAHSTQ